MNLKKTLYTKQLQTWPKQGRHILAQYDQESIVVYQAYRPSIGNFASVHQYFGGDFRLSRMSWIKPNFLWMMHRSGWGTKAGQEVILAVRMLRSGFDTILETFLIVELKIIMLLNSGLESNTLAITGIFCSSKVR